MQTEASSNAGAEPGRGDWYDTALSVATTIGKVAGVLSGAGSEGYVDFGPIGRSSQYPKLGSLVFMNEGGGIVAANVDPKNPLSLFFPTDNGSSPPGESVTIGPLKKLPISPVFATYAELDSFAVTPWRLDGGREAGGDAAATVRVSTTEPVRSGLEVSLGSAFKLRLSTSDRNLTVMTVAGFTLAAIILLNVRGSRNTVAQIYNVVRRGQDVEADLTSAVIPVPLGVDLGDGLHCVELVAEINGMQTALERQREEGVHLESPLSESDHARLERINARR